MSACGKKGGFLCTACGKKGGFLCTACGKKGGFLCTACGKKGGFLCTACGTPPLSHLAEAGLVERPRGKVLRWDLHKDT